MPVLVGLFCERNIKFPHESSQDQCYFGIREAVKEKPGQNASLPCLKTSTYFLPMQLREPTENGCTTSSLSFSYWASLSHREGANVPGDVKFRCDMQAAYTLSETPVYTKRVKSAPSAMKDGSNISIILGYICRTIVNEDIP